MRRIVKRKLGAPRLPPRKGPSPYRPDKNPGQWRGTARAERRGERHVPGRVQPRRRRIG